MAKTRQNRLIANPATGHPWVAIDDNGINKLVIINGEYIELDKALFQGAKGEKGDQGIPGPQGLPGQSGSSSFRDGSLTTTQQRAVSTSELAALANLPADVAGDIRTAVTAGTHQIQSDVNDLEGKAVGDQAGSLDGSRTFENLQDGTAITGLADDDAKRLNTLATLYHTHGVETRLHNNINRNTGLITSNTTHITANTTSIQNNTGDIAANATQIATNKNDIAGLKSGGNYLGSLLASGTGTIVSQLNTKWAAAKPGDHAEVTQAVAGQTNTYTHTTYTKQADGSWSAGPAKTDHLKGGQVDAYTKVESDAKYATKTSLTMAVAGKANVGSSYSKHDSDAKYALASALGNYYTKTQSDAKYATNNGLNSALGFKANVGDSYTKTEANGKFATKTSLTAALAGKADASTVAAKASITQLQTGLDSKADRTDITGLFTENADLLVKNYSRLSILPKKCLHW